MGVFELEVHVVGVMCGAHVGVMCGAHSCRYVCGNDQPGQCSVGSRVYTRQDAAPMYIVPLSTTNMSKHSNVATHFYSQFAALQSFSGDSHPAGMPSFTDGSHHAFILPAKTMS